MTIEDMVPQEKLGEGLYRVIRPYQPEALPRTDAGAPSTADAPVPADPAWKIEVDRLLKAGIPAFPTSDAFPGGEGDLHPRVLSLGVLAEDTAEGTALKEDHAADPGAIFETVPLDIDDKGRVAHLLKPA